MRVPLAILAAILAVPAFAADRLQEITRMHIEVLGGKPAIQALAGIRASGVLFLEQRRLKFTLLTARPNLLRLEGEADGHKFVQAYDGVDVPWQFDNQDYPAQSHSISEPSSSQLMADAEYDGPILSGKARGYTVNYAGEVERDGRKFLHLRVSWKLVINYSLLLDPETYLIVYRIDTRAKSAEKVEETVTRYDDYRPVDSVLVPHEIITAVDGRITEHMRVDRIEPNPTVKPDDFSRPDRPQGSPTGR